MIVQHQIAGSASVEFFFLIQNNSAFIRSVLSLILLQSFLHFININSPESLFCLVVLIYHRLFYFPFLSRPREMSSSAIKSKSFSKESLQPRDVGAVFLLGVIFISFSVFFPLHCLPPVPGSDSLASLEGTTLPTLYFLLSSMGRHSDHSFIFALMWRYQAALADTTQTQRAVPRRAVILLLFGGFFNRVAQTACFPSRFPSPSLLCFWLFLVPMSKLW